MSRQSVMAATAIMALIVFAPARAAESKAIVLAALEDGVYTGTMTGGIADKFKTITRSTRPVQAKVVLLNRFKDVGCGRLKFTLGQDNVPGLDGSSQPFETTFEMNVCADGSYPSDGVDLAQFPVPPQPSVKDVK
jgi:hypothetical protein